MRTPDAIERDIARCQDQLSALRGELARAKRHQAERQAATEHHRRVMQQVVERLEAGQWVAGVGSRLWWHSAEQALIKRATPDEMQAIRELRREGVVEGETIGRKA